ncbi:MAG: ROK family protein [Rhodothermales bacterium]|nr:ROK family protein [Rhodothermales bacterium]
MSHYAIGIDLGGTSIKAALVSSSDGLLHEVCVDTEADSGPDHVLDRIAGIIADLGHEAGKRPIAGVGIGSPGAIDWDRTTVSKPPNFPGWDRINLAEALTDRLERPLLTIVENDANVAGLGSAHYGAGREFDSFIMVTLGTGVGGAIIYQNRIFRGATGGAGEIGHMTIDYEGPYARSGVAGAIEGYLGQRFLSRQARYKLMNRRDSRIHDLAGEDLLGITPKMLYDAAVEGDEGAREVLAWAGHKLGVVLGSAVNLLDIRKIIVGGGLSAAGDFILESARETLPRYVTPGLHEGLEILQETSGNDVGMLGAAHLVLQHLSVPEGHSFQTK